jgi:hypothetical protein
LDFQTVDSLGDVGRSTEIAIGTDGPGRISYYDATNGNLKAAHRSNVFGLPYVRVR